MNSKVVVAAEIIVRLGAAAIVILGLRVHATEAAVVTLTAPVYVLEVSLSKHLIIALAKS